MNRKLRMGMVGGGRGAFIGGVHRIAANMDGLIELVAGAFSGDPANRRTPLRLGNLPRPGQRSSHWKVVLILFVTSHSALRCQRHWICKKQ